MRTNSHTSSLQGVMASGRNQPWADATRSWKSGLTAQEGHASSALAPSTPFTREHQETRTVGHSTEPWPGPLKHIKVMTRNAGETF